MESVTPPHLGHDGVTTVESGACVGEGAALDRRSLSMRSTAIGSEKHVRGSVNLSKVSRPIIAARRDDEETVADPIVDVDDEDHVSRRDDNETPGPSRQHSPANDCEEP